MDGVLNHSRLYSALGPKLGHTVPPDWIDPECVARVNQICERTGAVIIISSSWRYTNITSIFPGVLPVLRQCGLKHEIMGYTPVIEDMNTIMERGGSRWSEISAWLEANPGIEDWVALDDCDWLGFPEGRFVRTDITVGLTDADVEQCVMILGALA